MNASIRIVIFLALLGLGLHACQEDNFDTNPDIKLKFSVDTLSFDTVFTSIGSATRILKAYNPNNRPIEISRIHLEAGPASKFRMNVDGYTVDAQGNVFGTGEPLPPIPVAGKDSVYIFVEVTVDPDEPLSASPFVIHENLKFSTNGNEQTVVLEAFGQNANYLPSRFGAGGAALLSCDFGTITWDDPKPYVIYGLLVVDSCELVVPAGTDIYVHGGLVRADGFFYNDGILFFGPDSRLRMEGTLDHPVTLQGDRLEDSFGDVAGQWAGIRLGSTQNTHRVEHTIIKNSIVGLRVDSAATLEIKNSQIRNTSGSGLIGVHANIQAENCLIVDNGEFSAQLEYGGNYGFKYCTMANFGTDVAALRMSNAICQELGCGDCVENGMDAHFTNCIIIGSREDEITISDGCSDLPINARFEHCVLRVADLLEDRPEFFADDCVPGTCFNYTNSNEPLFEDRFDGDYHLDSLSFAAEKAKPLPDITSDLDGLARDANTPDVGCYESLY